MADNLTFVQYESGLLIIFNFALFLILCGLIFAIAVDPYLKRRQRKLLLWASVIVGSIIVQGQIDTYLGLFQVSRLGRILAAAYGYQMRPVVIALFIRLLDQENKRRWIWIPVIINALIYATSLFSRVAFTFLEDMSFMRGPLGYTCHVISLALLIYLLMLTISTFGRKKRLTLVTPIGITCLIIGAIGIDFWVGDAQWISYLTVSMVCSCLFFYVWLHIQFASEHERALMAERQVQVTIAQVQPHFLYSVLSTIQFLCKTNPDQALEVTERFEKYLRQNDDTLDLKKLIPFKTELKHTKAYTELEMIRYPNLRVEYDVKDDDFLIPALSLQPIIENALQQDELIREQGLIRISASREEDVYEVIVWDNGSGFQNNPDQTDPYHLGLKDVRERIENMCGGKLQVDSFPTDGTIITIRLPIKNRIV